MAHAFDNRNFIPGKQQTFYSVVSPSSRPDITNVLWEASSASPSARVLPSSPQASPKPNHPPPSYEESVFNKALANRHHSRSSLHSPSVGYYSNHPQQNSPTPASYVSCSLPATPNDSNHGHRQQQQSAAIDGYYPYAPPQRSSDTKPPPPARIPRVPQTANGTPTHRLNAPPQYSPNGMKTSTTYLNTTQLHINQSSPPLPPPPPPPPPPRYPLQPPAIPPRSSPVCHQSNSIAASDRRCAASPKPTSQMIYRSPVVSSTAKRNDLTLERQFNSLSLQNNNASQEAIDGSSTRVYSLGQCHQCHEPIMNTDDSCDIRSQMYHSSCAVCVICGRSVKHKHYFVKDQLYCEEDFLYTGFHQTLEHCTACGHLITDTVLQALGQAYHLACFKCSKCSLCLDGVPFISDKNRSLFCLHDYHMTYGPRCDRCSNPICPEDESNETVRIISMGKTFHVHCYQCQDCSLQLNDEPDRRCYPLGDQLLCQTCCRRRLASANHNL